MSIISAFGDDDHTASDSAYDRLLKVRKWLWIFSTAAILLHFNLYNDTAAKNLLKIIEIPSWLLKQATIAGISYLLIQSIFLIIQLFNTYDIILDQRMKFKQEEKLEHASNNIRTAQDELSKLITQNLEDLKMAISALMHRASQSKYKYDELHNKRSNELNNVSNIIYGKAKIMEDYSDEISKAELAYLNDKKDIESLSKQIDELRDNNTKNYTNTDIELARHRLSIAKTAYADIFNQNPANRTAFIKSEICLDAIRILPPFIYSFYALGLMVKIWK